MQVVANGRVGETADNNVLFLNPHDAVGDEVGMHVEFDGCHVFLSWCNSRADTFPNCYMKILGERLADRLDVLPETQIFSERRCKIYRKG